MSYVPRIEAATDRVTEALIASLEIEFGRGAGAALAERFLGAEEADFCWEARDEKRWLGAYESGSDGEFELDRVAVLGRLKGRRYVAQIIVDGEGCAHGLLGRREFGRANAARTAFADAH